MTTLESAELTKGCTDRLRVNLKAKSETVIDTTIIDYYLINVPELIDNDKPLKVKILTSFPKRYSSI